MQGAFLCAFSHFILTTQFGGYYYISRPDYKAEAYEIRKMKEQ